MKVVVCNAAGGGVTVEVGQGKGKPKKLHKALPGETVDVDDETAEKWLLAGVVKPVMEGAGKSEPPPAIDDSD